ncbi:hypothetical protein PV328_009940 [Microctonus aethiopoides]|uniref:Uncharacterized protein n=1 Tax=Microctonus aethiopoides TaxID=144406 RepID=A0AA39C6Z8_9HYME|nr:hypothetical protein PV328_009940 [Microctonus aethiopoides]
MIGREIKFENPKIHKAPDEKFHMIYMKELFSEERLANHVERLPSPVQMGMDKIRAKTLLGKYLVDFASSSSIHGLNHMTAPRRHIIERFLAALFIIAALASLILLSLTFWKRYQDDAIVIVLDHDYKHFTIKAPGVVICPQENVNEAVFPQVLKKYGLEDTIETRNFFRFISNATYETFNQTPEFNAVDSSKWLAILNDLKPNVQYQTFNNSKAKWIITERGFCLTFNNYISPYSSFDYWKNNNWTAISIPPQFPSYSYLKREITDQIRVKTHSVMFSIYPAGDVVNIKQKFYLCKRMSIVTIDVLVVEIDSSDQVAQLSLRQRKCKFAEEGGLEMWPTYSVNACRLECTFKRIRKTCYCYPHFARPTPGIPTCNAAQLRCIAANWTQIFLSDKKAAKECGCIANCNKARYVEASYSSLDLKKGSPADAIITPTVIFPTDKYERKQIFGFNDFLASVGGAAGLFLGASVISFVEIFYFATLRLYWYKLKIANKGKKKFNK